MPKVNKTLAWFMTILLFFLPWIILAVICLLSGGGIEYKQAVNSEAFWTSTGVYWVIAYPFVVAWVWDEL